MKECGSEFSGCYSRGYYKTLLGNDYTYGYGERAGKGEGGTVAEGIETAAQPENF